VYVCRSFDIVCVCVCMQVSEAGYDDHVQRGSSMKEGTQFQCYVYRSFDLMCVCTYMK
jgi:hypothetical protein